MSLDNDTLARSYFDDDFDVARIISSLSLELDMVIEPGNTLIVLDEVQACPKAITSLKYFCENASEYAIAAAGSLVGISATEGTGFPVGKVNILDLHPLSFAEFLNASGNERFAKLIASGTRRDAQSPIRSGGRSSYARYEDPGAALPFLHVSEDISIRGQELVDER